MAASKRPGVYTFVFALLGLIVTAGAVSAQVSSTTAAIVGTVTDQANAVVPKATVTVKNTAIGLTRTVDTDEAGYYSIPSLPEGSYDLSVTAPGFRPSTNRS